VREGVPGYEQIFFAPFAISLRPSRFKILLLSSTSEHIALKMCQEEIFPDTCAGHHRVPWSGVTIVDRFIRYNRRFQGQLIGKIHSGVGYLTGRKF
jgi:hypothetical protein